MQRMRKPLEPVSLVRGVAMTTLPPPDRFVLDGSVTLAWLFLDEQDPYADAIVAKLPNLEMLVPRLWHLEVANVLLVGERRRRCSQADTTQWLSYLARQNALTVYAAANLEIAIREGVPIATLDAPLKAAAQALGVPIYQP